MDIEDKLTRLEIKLEDRLNEFGSIVYSVSEASNINAKFLEDIKKDLQHFSDYMIKFSTIEVKVKELERKVTQLEEAKNWLVKIVFGIIIGAIIHILIKYEHKI